MRLARLALLVVPALAVACGDDTAVMGTDAGGNDTGAVDGGLDAGAGDAGHGDGGDVDPGPVCASGIDEDGDGVCDRERADFSADARLPASGDRRDIYGLGDAMNEVARRGIAHTLWWPVDVSGVLLPWRPMVTLFEPGTEDPATESAQALARQALGFGDLDEMYAWLGLARASGPEAWPGVAWPDGVETGDPLGVGRVETELGAAMSFSCATCHTADLFGRTVVGMTNRDARANEFFHLAAEFFPALTPEVFAGITGAEDDEIALFERTQRNLEAIGSVVPQVRGLDTSLAQVALSLARRGLDPYAEHDEDLQRNPRENALATDVADSKPAVWWTMRYKTRWLSDGSIVSGNPVFTNFLWNELGRGTDLYELEAWLAENRHVVDELTVLVFATEAPRWVDWFGVETVDEAAAQRGQALFDTTCATCHGTYTMGWDDDPEGPLEARIQRVSLAYHEQTPVLDVGTDPWRAAGMAAFADRLNELAISQWMQTTVEVQSGYVPPPLDGIWARYPYLHNQSVPTLCDMLRPASERTPVFWMGPSADAETDFDADCVGYPVGDAVPAAWQDDPSAEYDTSRPGLSNGGHDEWLVNEDGSARFSDAEIADLVAFLKLL